MFTGIIEEVGTVCALKRKGGNLRHRFLEYLEKLIDQSVAHNGVCLTVVDPDTNRAYRNCGGGDARTHESGATQCGRCIEPRAMHAYG